VLRLTTIKASLKDKNCPDNPSQDGSATTIELKENYPFMESRGS
jgi:hypothetical protein